MQGLQHPQIAQGLLFWLFVRGLEFRLGTASWYRSSYGTDLDIPESIVILVVIVICTIVILVRSRRIFNIHRYC